MYLELLARKDSNGTRAGGVEPAVIRPLLRSANGKVTTVGRAPFVDVKLRSDDGDANTRISRTHARWGASAYRAPPPPREPRD